MGDVRLGELRVPVHHHHGCVSRVLRISGCGRPARVHGHGALRHRHHAGPDDHRARLAYPRRLRRLRRRQETHAGLVHGHRGHGHGGDVLHRSRRMAPRTGAVRRREHRDLRQLRLLRFTPAAHRIRQGDGPRLQCRVCARVPRRRPAAGAEPSLDHAAAAVRAARCGRGLPPVLPERGGVVGRVLHPTVPARERARR